MAKGKAAETKKTTTAASATAKEKSAGDIVSALAEKTGLQKSQVKTVIDAYGELLLDELKSTGSVQLAGGAGKLKVGERAAREGRNPATGEKISIPAGKSIKFSAGKRFKDGIA